MTVTCTRRPSGFGIISVFYNMLVVKAGIVATIVMATAPDGLAEAVTGVRRMRE